MYSLRGAGVEESASSCGRLRRPMNLCGVQPTHTVPTIYQSSGKNVIELKTDWPQPHARPPPLVYLPHRIVRRSGESSTAPNSYQSFFAQNTHGRFRRCRAEEHLTLRRRQQYVALISHAPALAASCCFL